MTERIRSVAVVGGGVAALLSALTIARLIPKVTVIHIDTGTPDSLLDDLTGVARPSLCELHKRLGVDDQMLVARRIAGLRLGTLVSGWNGSGKPWLRSSGSHGATVDGVSAFQVWLRARELAAEPIEFEELSLLAMLARAGAALPGDDDLPERADSGGLQLSMPEYRDALRAFGKLAGAIACKSRCITPSLSNTGDRIEAIVIETGERITADLFIDATGCAAVLRRALPWSFESWGRPQILSRVQIERMSFRATPLPYDELSRTLSGWRLVTHLPEGVTAIESFEETHMNSGRSQGETSRPIALQQGSLRAPWRENCLAIGSAAVAAEPATGVGVHLLARQLDRLVKFWPGRDCSAVETAPYNQLSEHEAARIRSFIELPYALEAGGAASANLDQVDGLIEAYRSHGRFRTHDNDPIEVDEWLSVLTGIGATPRRTEPLAASMPARRAVDIIRNRAAKLAEAAQGAPRYEAWLSHQWASR